MKEHPVKIERRKKLTANIGVFGVGHHTYWSQFDGLLDEIKKKQDIFIRKVPSLIWFSATC